MKHDGRALSHEVLETYRFAAIKLQRSGVEMSVIANSFNVTERAVYSWIRKNKQVCRYLTKIFGLLSKNPLAYATQYFNAATVLRTYFTSHFVLATYALPQ